MNKKSFQFNKNTTALFQAILKLSSIKEAESFFRDLCTIEELQDMSERWQMVLLLGQGLSYRDIAARLKTSTTTVSRVAFWLKEGTGGYTNILKKLSHHRSTSRQVRV